MAGRQRKEHVGRPHIMEVADTPYQPNEHDHGRDLGVGGRRLRAHRRDRRRDRRPSRLALGNRFLAPAPLTG